MENAASSKLPRSQVKGMVAYLLYLGSIDEQTRRPDTNSISFKLAMNAAHEADAARVEEANQSRPGTI